MICGIINVYKEAGYTSHDVVAKLRGIAGQKKIGHTGTLDPAAEGVLPVCLGSATKVCDMLTEQDKTYHAVLLLGVRTDTQDTTGTILSEQDPVCEEARIRQVMNEFLNRTEQVPPMYSALKVNGKRLYELAREGKEVERKARPVRFYRIEPLRFDGPLVEFLVTCSKGTYIRTLCADIGERLGCGGCMKSLVRTQVGRFGLSEARTLGELQQLADAGRLSDAVLAVDKLFSDFPAMQVSEQGEHLLRNGNFLPENSISSWYAPGEFPVEPAEASVTTQISRTAETSCPAEATRTAEIICPAEEKRAISGFRGIRVYDPSGVFQAVYRKSEQPGEEGYRPWKTFFGMDSGRSAGGGNKNKQGGKQDNQTS